jgi:hypothetical protein
MFILWFSLPIAAGALGAALLGIFSHSAYARETGNWAAQAVGQDVANLVAYCALILVAVLAARGALWAYLAWVGLLGYSVYTLGSYRGAIGVLAVAGLAACAVAGAGAGAATKQPPAFEGPLGGVSAVLHGGIAVLVVAGLIVPSAALVLALAAVIAAAWLVGTIHRLTRQVPRARSHGLAA